MYTHTRTHTHTHTHKHTHIPTHTYTHAQVHSHTDICTHRHTHTYMHTHALIRTFIRKHANICACGVGGSGRNVLVCCSADGDIQDVHAAPSNCRTRVHEYGGMCHLSCAVRLAPAILREPRAYENFERIFFHILAQARATPYWTRASPLHTRNLLASTCSSAQ